MEIQSFEFRIEDLSIRRPWITKLYIQDNKTEAEIAGMLYEPHFFATYVTILLMTSSID
jgi:hypothetical protein